MIPIAEADAYLQRLLSEDKDSAGEAGYPQEVRYRALQEGVIAIAKKRPDEFSVVAKLPYDADSLAYKLSTEFDRLLQVRGIEIDGELFPLKGATLSQMAVIDACWSKTTDDPATHFVWMFNSPRLVFTNGKKEGVIVADVLKIEQKVDGNQDVDLPVPRGYFTELIDWALSRCYHLEATGGGEQTVHMQSFAMSMNSQITTHDAMNPLSAYQEGER